MNVLMISGAYPPDICGVGDYTFHLVHALEAGGADVRVLRRSDWGWRASGPTIAEIKRSRCDILHIQYPSTGYGYSLLPQILSARFPAIVTLHEFSRARVPRKLASSLFLHFAKRLVFTSDYELGFVQRFLPRINRKSLVIPIGTNIAPHLDGHPRLGNEVVYFGLITPRKGLEQIMEFASAARQCSSCLRIRMMGQIPAQYLDYARTMIDRSRDLPVTWDIDKPESEVAEVLARTTLAYLPFPDGASERRGSLRAMLSSGVVCITTEGNHLPNSLRRLLVFARDGKEAFGKATALLADQLTLERLSSEGVEYSRTFAWDSIAKGHFEVYEDFQRRFDPVYE